MIARLSIVYMYSRHERRNAHMLVALLSPDHERLAAGYLHMAPQMLEQRLRALRGRLDAS
jgi:hypothetical protein